MPLEQLRDFAKILAVLVLPVPREPTNRYAGAIKLRRNAPDNERFMNPCPMSSESVVGRYFVCSDVMSCSERCVRSD